MWGIFGQQEEEARRGEQQLLQEEKISDEEMMTPVLFDREGNFSHHRAAVPGIDNDLDHDDYEDAYEYEYPIDAPTSDENLSLHEKARMFDQHARAAERLSIRLLAVDGDEDKEMEILRESLGLLEMEDDDDDDEHQPHHHAEQQQQQRQRSSKRRKPSLKHSRKKEQIQYSANPTFFSLLVLSVSIIAALFALLFVGIKFVGPPNQPVGPYLLVERQEGNAFFNYYNFYVGRDSAGSAGYNTYISQRRAIELGIVNVTKEKDVLDVYFMEEEEKEGDEKRFLTVNETVTAEEAELINATKGLKNEPFVYMASAPTREGTRESIRLEGKRRFNRGLFIIDLRHMPAGCGVWPAFWLTDEANWPVNGEIDIVEGVNYQSEAKTALHTTQGCSMYDIPHGLSTGKWDPAVGIPDAETGIPDMTFRYAQDCFVYNVHQWLNQGCVGVDKEGGTIGVPFNQKGGGVYVLEWDPIYKHIRSWVFTPHSKVPDNLRDAIRTASHSSKERIAPDPRQWPLPYAYYAIGEFTSCPAEHFKNMRLVFNLAFCGSVAGERFHMDCKEQSKRFATCNDWIRSEPDELNEAYWKIRGVYVYEREWERAWV